LAQSEGDPVIGAERYWEGSIEGAGLSSYEKAAARLYRQRTTQGGMMGDRWACLGGMVMVKMRGLKKTAVQDAMEEGMRRHFEQNGRRKPRIINLPWYVMDMHTAVGKFAMSVHLKRFAEKYPGLDRDKLDAVWFLMESVYSPPDQMTYQKYDRRKKLTPVDNMWFVKNMQLELPFGDYSAKEVSELWKSKMRKQLSSLVEWCAQKRAEKD